MRQQERKQMSIADTMVVRRKGQNERLEQMGGLVNWGRIDQLLSPIYAAGEGRPAYRPLVMVRALLLQQWYWLSDPALEEAVCDRFSFRRFVGLSLDEQVPDHSTLSRFRAQLVKHGLSARVFDEINRQLERRGLMVKRGTLIDATLVAAGSNGNVTPTASITGATTGLADPTGIALDSSGSIYVANSGSQVGGVDSITIYLAGSNGNASPSSTISGVSTGLAVPYGIALDSSGNIYVANDGSTIGISDSVTVYAPGSSGNAAPSSTISGSSNGLDSPGGIAIDTSGNLYVTNDGSVYGGVDSITVYAPGSNGNAAPSATMFALGLDTPLGVAVDSVGNLYVANDGSTDGDVDTMTVYPPNNTLPSATIGSNTGLDEPSGIAVDSGGNIYVTNEGSVTGGVDSVTVYSPGSYANAVPTAAIVGSNTGLDLPYGIVTDTSGNIYVANSAGGSDGLGSVTVYLAGSNGNVAPSAAISGDSNSDNAGFNFPTGIALDSSGNLYVANVSGGPDGFGSITIYSARSSGNVAPIATISDDPSCAPCDNTGLSFPYGIALDSTGNIYVANAAGGADGLGSVTVYPPLGSGNGIVNEPPSATIRGSSINDDNTGFDSPSGIALDSGANIYVTNDGSSVGGTDSITVYSAGSSGNVVPIITITGFSTGLGGPQGIAIGPDGGGSS